MKTFDECLNEVAKNWGYNNWSEIDWYQLDYNNHDTMHWFDEYGSSETYLIEQAAKIYATYCCHASLDRAAKNARITQDPAYSIRVTIVSKDSITDPSNIILF